MISDIQEVEGTWILRVLFSVYTRYVGLLSFGSIILRISIFLSSIFSNTQIIQLEFYRTQNLRIITQ